MSRQTATLVSAVAALMVVAAVSIGLPHFVVGVLAASALGVAVTGGYLSMPSVRALRAMRRAPRLLVAQSPDRGRVRLTGRLRYACEPMLAPITRRPCVGFEVRVTGLQDVEALYNVRCGDFFIDDPSGAALVRAEHAELAIVSDVHVEVGSCAQVPTGGRAELLEIGDGPGRVMAGFSAGTGNYRYWEGVLEVGSTVAVCGMARREPDPNPASAQGYRETPMRLVLSGSPTEPLFISDDVNAVTMPSRRRRRRA